MKKMLIGAALLALAPAIAAAADMSGAWKIDGAFDAMGINYTVTCKLAEGAGGALAGPCTGSQGEAIKATGKVSPDGKTVELAYDTTYNGGPVHLDYTGAVQPDGSLKGAVDAGAAQGTFTATRQ
ncbi:MAG TPA: hypothetical protein VMU93_11835 [Caulobacteraceae bacterium]|nr:hypothetical protein [Caulobacteraceae bacterium]